MVKCDAMQRREGDKIPTTTKIIKRIRSITNYNVIFKAAAEKTRYKNNKKKTKKLLSFWLLLNIRKITATEQRTKLP